MDGLIANVQTFRQIDTAYMGRENNENIFSDNRPVAPNFYAPGRPWYLAAKNANGNVITTAPYTDFHSGNLFITVAQHIGLVNGVDAVGVYGFTG